MAIKKINSSLPMEKQIGYSRAIVAGNFLFVSATAPVDDNMNVIGKDGKEQLAYVVEKLTPILEEAGFTFDDTIAVKLYQVDLPQTPSAYETFAKVFGKAAPVIAVAHVTPWPNGMLLELELTAYHE
ncbi:MAG: hypothetical protein LBN10_05400 [Propionibacteriaceae bacterium]|jgi:enamine deaminase RidA (YjgF/YER057c/UK114 family)|nr:hypothetical protein [Propionibacteriaceae bacterium]